MAAMSRTRRAFPRPRSGPTCMESALIISPRSLFPTSMASLDLPVPVAPKITTNDGTVALRKAHFTLPADAAMMPLTRRPADGRAHAHWGQDTGGGLCCQATGNGYFGNVMRGLGMGFMRPWYWICVIIQTFDFLRGVNWIQLVPDQ